MQPKGDMESQLRSLYEERERLHQALGTADADKIIELVRSLEEQLLDLYREKAAQLAESLPERTADD
ncbi:MAG: hypothetical protein KJO07_06855 [Deltaproteobacteria bacterium]|jgi:hypothetical protein|nr:hypothetical protein [Deltaproteobacteria bacterium]